jgi:hypothetical protein
VSRPNAASRTLGIGLARQRDRANGSSLHVKIFIVSKRPGEYRSGHMAGRSARGHVVNGHVARSV